MWKTRGTNGSEERAECLVLSEVWSPVASLSIVTRPRPGTLAERRALPSSVELYGAIVQVKWRWSSRYWLSISSVASPQWRCTIGWWTYSIVCFISQTSQRVDYNSTKDYNMIMGIQYSPDLLGGPVVCLLVGWLLNAPATCWYISGTILHRQLYVLPHWDGSCRPNFLPHPVTVYSHRADQSQRWPYNARRLAG